MCWLFCISEMVSEASVRSQVKKKQGFNIDYLERQSVIIWKIFRSTVYHRFDLSKLNGLGSLFNGVSNFLFF